MHGPRNGVPASASVIIRLTPEQYQSVARAALGDERSMSSWARRVIADQLAGLEEAGLEEAGLEA